MASGSPAEEQPSIQDEDLAQMKAFDAYQWQFDKDFLHGALQITKGLDRPQALQALLQARLWWYQSKKEYAIQLPQYKAYEAARQQHEPDFKSPDGGILAKLNAIRKHMSESEEKRLAEDAAKVPGWQKYARKANLQLKADQEGAEIQDDSASIVGLLAGSRGGDGDANADNGGAPAGSSSASGEAAETAPYPERFKHIAEAVVSGKQIPGVKLIPDTVIRPLGVTPVGTMQAPLKPWERNRVTGAGGSTADGLSSPSPNSFSLVNVLDRDFPPLEDTTPMQTRREEDAMMQEG